MRPLIRLIRYAEHVEMNWKNGGGQTREIAREDDAGELLWRLSLATVTRSGPFSVFPGLDRIIALIEGQPMTLYFEDGETIPLARGTPQQFSCERPLRAELSTSQPCRDLNLLFRKEEIRARAESIRFDGRVSFGWSGVLVAIFFIVDGVVTVSPGGEQPGTLGEGDTFIYSSPDPAAASNIALQTSGAGAECLVFLISLAETSNRP